MIKTGDWIKYEDFALNINEYIKNDYEFNDLWSELKEASKLQQYDNKDITVGYIHKFASRKK